jgi:predicted nucleic acid-binding Zn finger protein
MNSTIPLIEEQMQSERMARAQVALLRGEMAILPQRERSWTVASKGSRYTVILDEGAWACTCPDFAGRCQRFGLRCKHIEAVRVSEAGQNGYTHTLNQPKYLITEEQVTQALPSNSTPTSDTPRQVFAGDHVGKDGRSDDEIIWRLRQPLDMNRVKRRQAPGQGTVPYLNGFDVIEAANELFLFHWSFDLLSEPKVMRWDKVVTFYDQRAKKKVPVLGEDGKPTTEITGVAYITGRISVELGGKSYCHADVGRCIFNGDTPEALDTAIAGAVTDCLKRCFRQLGEQFGNSLYDKEIARAAVAAATARQENSASTNPNEGRNTTEGGKPSQEPSLDSRAEASTLSPQQPEVLLYQDGTAVFMNNVAEVSAYNTYKSAHNGQAPASRDVLRAWSNGRKGKR